MSKEQEQAAEQPIEETEESLRDTAADDLHLSDIAEDREPEVAFEETLQFPDGEKVTRTEFEEKDEGKPKAAPEKGAKKDEKPDKPSKRRQPPPTEQERHEIRSARRSEREALAAREQAERDAQMLREQNEALLKRLDKIDERLAGEHPAQDAPQSLKPDDYDDYDDYVKAVADQAVKAALAGQGTHEQPKPEPEPAQESDKTFEAAVQRLGSAWNDGKDVYEDFDETMAVITQDPHAHDPEKAFPMPRELVLALSESDAPVELGYYLAQHRDEAAHLASLKGRQLDRELGRLEAQLETGETSGAATEDTVEDVIESSPTDVQTDGDIQATERVDKNPPRRATRAPKPIKPLGGATKPLKNPDSMSQQEYQAARRAGKL